MIDAVQDYIGWAWEFAQDAAFHNPLLLLLYGVEIFLALIFPLIAIPVFIVALPFQAGRFRDAWRGDR